MKWENKYTERQRYPRLQNVNKMKKQTNISSASRWSCPICVNWSKLISSWSVIAIRSRSSYRKEPSWSLEVISGMPCMLFAGKVTPIFMRKWPLNVLADPYVCQFDLTVVLFVTFDWCADKRGMIIIWDGIKRGMEELFIHLISSY